MKIHWIDLTIIIVYLLGITLIGVVMSRRQTESSARYFLAGRSLGWVTVGLALFATNISTVHLIGLASSGYSDGMVVGNFEWLAPFLLIMLGLVFAPFYFGSKISTLPEYLEGRYGPASRTFLAFMAVVGALFIHIGVTLYAGAVMFQNFVDMDILWSILIVSFLTVIYTVAGGLKAVVITESIQTVLLLVGATAVTAFGLVALHDRGITSLEALTEAAKPGQMSMIRTEGEYAWWIMLLGYPVLGVWYWCSDQTIVQRVLGAKTERDAQIGPIFAGFIKVLPVFLMVLPGVIGYVLFADKIGENPDATLITLIQELLPVGLQGFVVAGLLAALMSTVAGALNSTSTLVSIDIVKRIRPETSDHALVRIGQITTVVVMILAIAWSTQGERFGGIFKGINAMIAVLAPPISTVFVWGIFWRRGTAAASLTTMLVGFILGAIVFAVDFPAMSGLLLGVDSSGEPIQLVTKQWGIPFMLQAWWLFVICSVLFVITSYLTKPPDAAQLDRYCWRHPFAVIAEKRIEGPWDPRVLSGTLILLMATCYWIFA
ncbi:sodium:solute symporter [Rhodopirellula sallentina]|uniref:Solute carrier family 5, member 3 n=1 Tax=Rhodopirellula sallentina SM41 TaxID=1263870 RepID=M5U913_9BACT|nr:sodium:solute symporter [Rhodopirellula sallentina]EMI57749.1 solute carrier family 5, member 3 [Rhodopirellula sallentina SM41]